MYETKHSQKKKKFSKTTEESKSLFHFSHNKASINWSNHKHKHPSVHGLWERYALIEDKCLKHAS